MCDFMICWQNEMSNIGLDLDAFLKRVHVVDTLPDHVQGMDVVSRRCEIAQQETGRKE